MDTSTAITAGSPPPAPPLPTPEPKAVASPKVKPLYLKILEVVASLRITVTLFALSILLVLFGTLAQVDISIWAAVNTYFRSAFVWVPFRILVPRSDTYEIYGGFPFPGGWLLGGLLLANLLAAHAIRFKVTWKRSGILLIHAGLIVMMLSELITGLYAIEGRLQIDEGKGSNYIQDHHASELAVTEAQDDKFDSEVVIPDRFLKAGQNIPANLPFEIEVVRYLVHSAVVPYIPDDFQNPATVGFGRKWVAIEKASIEGTQTGGEVDTPSAYVTLKTKSGQNIGTYLVSSHTIFLASTNPVRYLSFPPQPVEVDGKTYFLSLRHKRTYQPYTMHLIKGETVYYPGTEKPKSYSSTILLLDPSRNEKREITISMNNPLRYGGETFFQSGMNGGVIDGRPVTFTVLQVVRNPGWLMPYISCAMVSIGMIIHFGMNLMTFMEKEGRVMKSSFEYLKYVVVGVAALYLVSGLFPKTYPANQMQIDQFGALPMVGGGRIKPFDSEARIALMAISNRQSFKEKDGDKTKTEPAIKWLLDVMTSQFHPIPAEALKLKIFRIDDSQLLAALKLEPRPDFLHAYEEFEGKLFDIHDQAELAVKIAKDKPLPEKDELLYGKAEELLTITHKVLALSKGASAREKVFHIENDQLLNVLALEQRKGFQYALLEFLPKWPEFMDQVKRAGKVDEKQRDLFDRKILDLWGSLGTYQRYALLASPNAIPPQQKGGEWQTFLEAKKTSNPKLSEYLALLKAYAENDVEKFNEFVKDIAKDLGKNYVSEINGASSEVLFNHFSPFEKCALLYGLVFLLICFSWFGATPYFQESAFWLATFIFIVQTVALIVRISLSGRPPVTNLYSSAVFIGWGCVFLCLFLEYIFHNGMGTLVASVLGGLTLIVAHNLAASGDTMEVLVAVLDTNFWLATHVVCVTLGYTATFVAGFFGIAYVVLGLFTTKLNKETTQNMTKMIYGTVCFAMLLSFTGTVLGGIWADQSWGRFWGWDPKENGALIIVLWNALLLHARWGGLVKARGIALLAIGGNIVTAWSWFGVNMLGVGLHNYGFMPGHLLWMCTFVGSQLLLIGLGSLPDKYWKSLMAQKQVFNPPAAVKPNLDMPNGSSATANGEVALATGIKPAPGKNGKAGKSAKVKVKK